MSTALQEDETKKPSIPTEFLCPITCEIMADPHITLSGHTYEKYAIEQWLASHSTDPLTNAPLTNKLLIPNHTLRKQIQTFIEKNNIKLRSNKSSPFKYLLCLLRLHANQMKSMHFSSNLLQRYSNLFLDHNMQYHQIITRFLSDWRQYSKSIEAKWIDILAKTLYIKENIYTYHSIYLESDSDDEEQSIVNDLFQNHVIKSLISIKTSLREIVSLQAHMEFTLKHFFEYTNINAFVKKKKSANADHNNEEKKAEHDEDNDGGGLITGDFEDDLTAISMFAGAMIGANTVGVTGAAMGSVAGPVGTMFGAALGFYVGAITGSVPSMIYGIYVESEKARQQEVDRMWKLMYLGFKKYNQWIDKERLEFKVCDAIIVESMQSILNCIDCDNVDLSDADEIDFVYQSLDHDLVQIWQYDISRITPILQECLVKHQE